MYVMAQVELIYNNNTDSINMRNFLTVINSMQNQLLQSSDFSFSWPSQCDSKSIPIETADEGFI